MMRNKLIGLGVSALTTIALASPATAQTVETCFVIDDYIPVGEAFLYPEPESAYIDGEEPGSRVNVRTGPGTEYEVSSYGLVGDAIDIIGQAFSSECGTWIKVRFPESGFEGWIFEQFIGTFGGGRGWWD
ncbi:MAG: SH3 domain-containing protein [Cyanobacteria bacterium J06639_14]